MGVVTVHTLKCISPYFEDVRAKRKRFELRKDDRGFAVGDTLVLVHPETGARTSAFVEYILRDCPQFGLMPGHVIMGLGWPDAFDAATLRHAATCDVAIHLGLPREKGDGE